MTTENRWGELGIISNSVSDSSLGMNLKLPIGTNPLSEEPQAILDVPLPEEAEAYKQFSNDVPDLM
jgi:hypothetical protein